MAIRKIQMQRMYGSAPTARSYRRLRLPREMAEQYVAEHGKYPYMRVESPDTLLMGGPAYGVPVHLVVVKESRGIAIRRYYQVMIPVDLSGEIRGSEPVDITREGDTIQLRFGRAIFTVDERAVPDRPPPARADPHDAAPDSIERRLIGIESAVDRLGARIKRIEYRLGR